MKSSEFKIRIREPYIKRVRRSIDWYCEHAIQRDGENAYTWRISFDSQISKEILVSYVEVTPEIPESTKRIATRKAILRFLKYKSYRKQKNRVEAFIKALDTELGIASRNIQNFWVVMFMNLDRNSTDMLGSQKIHGIDFEFVKWQSLSRFDLRNMWDQTQYQMPESSLRKNISPDRRYTNQTDFSPLVSVHRTFDSGGAVNEAVQRVGLMRSAVNLPRISSFRISLRSKPEALSVLCPSPIYGIFHDSGDFETAYFAGTSHRYKRLSVNAGEIPSFKKIMGVLNSAPGSSYCRHVADAMELYQSALDSSNPQQAFLRLWQALEVASAPDIRNPRQDLISKRIKTLLNLSPHYSDTLQMLTEKRNSLVHSGSFPSREDDILFAIKPYADALMWRLINLADEFNSVTEFQEYLSHINLSNTALLRRRQIINEILGKRGKKKSNS